MSDIEARLEELRESGLMRRMRMVSGPQGPRVVLDGKPVLMLSSENHLGLADHPALREAAADAAMRWGVGAGSPRTVSGSMTIHRRLEERLADLTHTGAALLYGSGYLARIGVTSALAAQSSVVLCDEACPAATTDGCRLSGAETIVYDHLDVDHLAWGLTQLEGRAAVIVTDSVFGVDGDVAPLAEIAALARRHRVRLIVDESHAIGCVGPGGRGALAEAGLEGEVDAIIGTLGAALGSYGGFVACSPTIARYLANASRPLSGSAAPPPPSVAAALAALQLLAEQPRRVDKLQANAELLRGALAKEGFHTEGSTAHVVSLVIGDAGLTGAVAAHALEAGVAVAAINPPLVAPGTSRLRLTPMASHTKDELREAARVLGRAALKAGFRPGAGLPIAAAPATASRARAGVFDAEAA